MSRSLNQLPLRLKHEPPPPPPPPPPPTEKTSYVKKEGTFSKALGLPLRSLVREPKNPIPPPPNDNLQEPPETSSPRQSPRRELGSLKEEGSFPLPLLQPQKEIISASPKIESSSFPASPLRSPLCGSENTLSTASPQLQPAEKENNSRSPGRDGAIVVTHLRSLLEAEGSPISQSESSPGKPSVANRMAASKVVGSGGRRLRVQSGIVRRAALRRAENGLRVSEMVLCAVAFSVMAADRTGGWAGDSFDRYPEFRYCFSTSVMAFAYSGFQVCDQIHYWIRKRHIISRQLSYYFDLSMDQVLAYLLLSASSSAATRNNDWVSMFGSDNFTDMMNGSIAVTFFAFLAFAISSIISAYKLFAWNT